MIYGPHPSSVKIAPGPILADDGWRTTYDGLDVNGLSYFLPERFWLKQTTDDWSGRRMVWLITLVRHLCSVIRHQSSASVTTIHTYPSFQSCGHRFLCTDSTVRVQSGKVVDGGIICGEFPIHSSLPWFTVRIRHPSSVKIAPGPILTDDGWRTTD